mmetsp:Transcript_141715/g.200729  ORF Transcript_141715/g.200729 Transcript_141715/m.200729 type:complete len:366 (-) Transcript_141715:90-1187(-)
MASLAVLSLICFLPVRQAAGPANESESCLLQIAPRKPIKMFLNANMHQVGDIRIGKLANCAVACEVTQDRSQLEEADIVVWNARWMGPLSHPPPLDSKPPHQRWVFNFDAEAPEYHGVPISSKEVNLLSPGIDWTFTFKHDSDFYKPYYALGEHSEPSTLQVPSAANKSMLLLWFVSNCGGKRREVFRSLASLLPPGKVKVYGGCGEKHPCGRSVFQNTDCLAEVAQPYKFYASFENNRCDGYITEKLWTAMRYGMVPIVWGGRSREDYEKLIPKGSFIHVDDFPNVEDLANFLQQLDKDTERYEKYFEWRKRYHIMSGLALFEQKYCELCTEVAKPWSEQRPARTFGSAPDALSTWWYSSCEDE